MRPARLALHSARTLYDAGVHAQYSFSLARLAAGAFAYLHPDDGARLGIAEKALVRVTGSAGSAGLEVKYDPTLAAGTIYIPFNQEDGWGIGSGLDVRIEVLS